MKEEILNYNINARSYFSNKGRTMKPITKAKVRLLGEDGNAYAILARTIGAMKDAKVDQKTIDKYLEEATSGDYANLIQTTFKYVKVKGY